MTSQTSSPETNKKSSSRYFWQGFSSILSILISLLTISALLFSYFYFIPKFEEIFADFAVGLPASIVFHINYVTYLIPTAAILLTVANILLITAIISTNPKSISITATFYFGILLLNVLYIGSIVLAYFTAMMELMRAVM